WEPGAGLATAAVVVLKPATALNVVTVASPVPLPPILNSLRHNTSKNWHELGWRSGLWLGTPREVRAFALLEALNSSPLNPSSRAPSRARPRLRPIAAATN